MTTPASPAPQVPDAAPPPAGVDAATLTPIVRRVLGSESATVVDWQHESLYTAVLATTGGIHRFAGTASVDGGLTRWSVVRKLVVRPAGATEDHTHPSYWKREPEAFASGLFARLPAGLATPRCYGVDEAPGAAAVWMEPVADDSGTRWSWPAARYATAGRALGRLGAAFAGAVPAIPWLSEGFLRARVGGAAPGVAALPDRRHEPLVQQGWPGDLLDRALRLRDRAPALLDALERLPRTLCHLDADRRNLFARRPTKATDVQADAPPGAAHDYDIVAIDWGYLGRGAVGEDLAPLVMSSFAWFCYDPDEYPAVSGLAWEGYLAGLRASGWSGDERDARFAFCAHAGLRFTFVPVFETFPPERRVAVERSVGQPFDAVLDRVALVRGTALDLADEALSLLPTLRPV